MSPLTHQIPKSLIRVRGRPFLEIQLELLASHGVREVVLCLSHQADQIIREVRAREYAGLDISFSLDGDEPRGTGGALCAALDLLPSAFFVLYGDSFTPVDLRAMSAEFATAKTRRAFPLAMMAIFRNEGRFDTGNVSRLGDDLIDYRKSPPEPRPFIDYGLSILERSVIESIPAGVVTDLADVYARLSRSGQLVGFEAQERFFEIGSPAGLADFETWLKRSSPAAR
ncbi:MAG: NTP transferase domain-containing protein [Deltaproteobacteria bacterium]|nr:NTP transferase domain-containing protein [Deltaproteobacteria bacterium]